MVAINIPVFAGMVPSMDPHSLSDENAQYAENAWLYSGVLDALPVKTDIYTLTNPDAKIVYRIPLNDADPSYFFESKWIEFSDVNTDFLKAPVIEDSFERYYWTAPNQAFPLYNTKARILANQSPYILGLPQPANLNVVWSGGVSATLVSRVYICTFVSAYGEEGPASNPFLVQNAKIDDAFTVTLPAVAAADMGTDRNITKIRLYRTIVSAAGTVTYYLAAEVPAKTITQDVVDPYTNLVIWSEDFSNAAWSKSNTTIGSNVVIAPDGNVTADKIQETAVNAVHSVTSTAVTIASGATVTGSLYFKAAERTTCQLRMTGTGGQVNVGIDLTAVTVTVPSVSGPFSAASATIDTLSGGWYRVNLSAATTGITSVSMVVVLGAIGADSYLGVVPSGLYVWGAQITATPFAYSYVKTTTAAVAFTLSDTILATRLILESTAWTAPGHLDGFVSMPNGIMAGFRGKELLFSEPYRPHAWPAAYGLSVEHDIVGLGVVGGTLVVCTKGAPMTASGVHPTVITTNKIATFEPCTSKGSIVATENGCYYTSPNGLIVVNAGIAQNITQQFITKDKWNEYIERAKVNAGRFGTAYFAYRAAISGSFDDDAFQQDMVQEEDGTGGMDGFMLDPTVGTIGFIRLIDDKIVRSIRNDAMSSEMFIVRDGHVQWLDFRPGFSRDTVQWRSKIFQTPMIQNFTAFKLWFNPSGVVPSGPQLFDKNQSFNAANQYGVVRIYANGELKLCYEFRTPGELFRMPSGFKADMWEIEIEARVRVTKFQMATSVKELQVA